MDSTALLLLWIKFLELRLLVKEYAVLRLLIFRARLSSGEATPITFPISSLWRWEIKLAEDGKCKLATLPHVGALSGNPQRHQHVEQIVAGGGERTGGRSSSEHSVGEEWGSWGLPRVSLRSVGHRVPRGATGGRDKYLACECNRCKLPALLRNQPCDSGKGLHLYGPLLFLSDLSDVLNSFISEPALRWDQTDFHPLSI